MDYIWTKHAITRLKERKIPQDLVVQVVVSPDLITDNTDGSRQLKKRFDDKTVGCVIKENDKGEFIILSCWINPPNPGTIDFKNRRRYFEMQKAGFIKKLWLTFLGQIGL